MSNVIKSGFERFPANKRSLSARSPVRGWGINDSDYLTQYTDASGKSILCPYYGAWREMLARVIDKGRIDARTYADCEIAGEWRVFSVFRKWAEAQVEDMSGLRLDKDILNAGNRMYCPEFCLLVPDRVNKMFTKSNKFRGNLPLGVSALVSALNTRYIAAGSIGQTNSTYIGVYDTVEEAAEAYNTGKAAYIRKVAEGYADNGPLYRAMLRQADTYESGEANLELAQRKVG